MKNGENKNNTLFLYIKITIKITLISDHTFKVVSYLCLHMFDCVLKGDGESIEEEFDESLIEIISKVGSKMEMVFGIVMNFGWSMTTKLLMELEDKEMVEESCDGK